MTVRGPIVGMVLGVTALFAAAYLKPCIRLVYNPTDSAPRGWYLVVPMIRAHPGDYVVVLLPSDTATLAATRGYAPLRADSEENCGGRWTVVCIATASFTSMAARSLGHSTPMLSNVR